MSIWSWFGNLFAPPPALQTRPGYKPGTTVQLHWDRALIPLDVYFDGGPESLFQPAFLAMEWWNQRLGRLLFLPPVQADPAVLNAFQDPNVRAYFKRSVLIRVDGSERDHGFTSEEYNKHTGEMVNAIVTLPAVSRRPVDVAAHELGHVLCLGHQDGGLMVAHLPPPGVPLPLAANQLKALKVMVG